MTGMLSTVIKDSLLHNCPQLSCIAGIKASSAAISIDPDHNWAYPLLINN